MRFLINTMTNWDEPPRARHQVAYALSKNYKVVFITANKRGFPAFKYRQINENLTIVIPFYPIDNRIRYRIPFCNAFYEIWLFRKLMKEYKDYEVINFDFTSYLIHKFFEKVTYYCNDNFTSISKKLNIWPIYKYHSFCERKLIAKANLCIGTSRMITNNLLKINKRSFEIPLGGPDITEFNIQPNPKNETKNTLNVGLVGFIKSYNLSVRLLNELISQIDCQITLIGPLDPEFYNKIINKSRINYKGILTGIDLLNEINQFDVAIAPYLDKIIDEGGIPNKLLIYLALGKPVVLTELMSLKELDLADKLIYTVKDNCEFPSMILKAHNENNSALIQKRTQYAKDNTWDKRISQFIELLKV